MNIKNTIVYLSQLCILDYSILSDLISTLPHIVDIEYISPLISFNVGFRCYAVKKTPQTSNIESKTETETKTDIPKEKFSK